ASTLARRIGVPRTGFKRSGPRYCGRAESRDDILCPGQLTTQPVGGAFARSFHSFSRSFRSRVRAFARSGYPLPHGRLPGSPGGASIVNCPRPASRVRGERTRERENARTRERKERAKERLIGAVEA